MKGSFLAECDRGSGVPIPYVIVAVLGGAERPWDHAGDAKACQKGRPLAIAPALMSAIAKASGTTNRLSSVRGASAELPDQAQSCLPSAEDEAGVAACEQTPLPSEHGLKRRRQSDETPRPSTKFRAAGRHRHTRCLTVSALMISMPHEGAIRMPDRSFEAISQSLYDVQQGTWGRSLLISIEQTASCSDHSDVFLRRAPIDTVSVQDTCKASGACIWRYSRTRQRIKSQEKSCAG